MPEEEGVVALALGAAQRLQRHAAAVVGLWEKVKPCLNPPAAFTVSTTWSVVSTAPTGA